MNQMIKISLITTINYNILSTYTTIRNPLIREFPTTERAFNRTKKLNFHRNSPWKLHTHIH